LPSFAKINLSLRVVGKRGDGFHELCTVFQTISLADEIRIGKAGLPPLFFFPGQWDIDKTGTDGTNGTIFQIWWDSGTIDVKYNRYNNKVSHQAVPFPGPVGQYQQELRLQA
jgi:hypothetical protein